MIIEEIQRPPFIHFGLMKQSITVLSGVAFKVYQKNVYNSDYVFKINNVVASYENEYTLTTTGNHYFSVKLNDKLSPKEMNGNTITVTVI